MARPSKNVCLPLLFLAACAGGPPPQASPSAEGAAIGSAPSRNLNRITREELSDPSLVGTDLMQVIRRMRPQFLMTRGTVSKSNAAAGAVQLSLDGGSLQPLSNLNALRVEEVQEVRYFNASEAAQKFGSTASSGPVIMVTRR